MGVLQYAAEQGNAVAQWKRGRMYATGEGVPRCSMLFKGRNHHSAGTGVIIELRTGFPGYTGIIPQSTAMIPEILRANGYASQQLRDWRLTRYGLVASSSPAKSTTHSDANRDFPRVDE
jgi:arylsulfatase A-like enzyme